MGEIITALIMIMIAIGPVPKNKLQDRSATTSVAIKFKETAYKPEDFIWTAVPGIKKATFTREGKTWTDFYNWHNELVATVRQVDIVALHPNAIRNLVSYYPGYQMGEILEFAGPEITYFIYLQSKEENFLVKITPDNQVSFFKKLPSTSFSKYF